ncbi:MAG: GPW/gp25 family protein [Treponema sp.]|jgi:predicted component of type VI protein secretion system|nr:GPW/gp25 family protein [Treponema sp.]
MTALQTQFQPIVLRRLTDLYPHEKKDNVAGPGIEKQLKDDVLENITMLFNSRSHPSLTELNNNEEIENSVLGYGLSDCCGKMEIKTNHEDLRQEVIRELQVFEPRLAPESIAIEFVRTKAHTGSLVEFQISALIEVGEISKDILLLARLDVETGIADVFPLTD